MKLLLNCAALALVGVGLYHRIQAARTREPIDRRKEGLPLLFGIRLSALAVVVALWNAPTAVPSIRAWAGTAGFVLSVAWLIWMFRSLGSNLTDTVVTRRASYFVSNGPYRFVRNPMYVGVLGAGLSLSLVFDSIAAAGFTILCFTLLAIRTRREERYLIERFGQVYRDYMRQVGRFVPRFMNP